MYVSGRGEPSFQKSTVAESGSDCGMTPSPCTSPSLTVWYNTSDSELQQPRFRALFYSATAATRMRSFTGRGSTWQEAVGAQATSERVTRAPSVRQLCVLQMTFSWNAEQASLTSPWENNNVELQVVPPFSQLLPPAQALFILLYAYATGQFVPCEHRANPTWQTDKLWTVCSC